MNDENRIASIIGEWVEARNRGERVDPEEVVRAHPELAEELSRRLAVLSRMDRDLREEGGPGLRTLPLDRYRDYRPAGEGGMGIVYWAIDTDLNREVALKIVRPGARGASEETPEEPIGLAPPGRGTPASKAFETLKARFLQEAWVTGGMAHPGIVPVYELGQTPEGVPYYTMRFVKGSRTLSSAIEGVEGSPVEDRLALLETFLKVCDTMSYAHAHGVIHRDLKPENVALGEFGEVVVLDWGLAKTRDGPDVTETLWKDRIREFREATDLRTLAGAMGTPGYMSPEAALGRAAEVDERSDVYGLGAILFEILTGRLPFAFESYLELVRKLGADEAPSARSLEPDLPEGLSDICARALAREAEDRPASAEVLAREIRTWQTKRAADLEVAGLLREAKGALAGAEGLAGDALVRQLDRAGAACSQVLAKRPGDAEARGLRKELGRLRARGIAERERAARGRVLRRGGVALLAVATVATVLVALTLEDRRRRAEDAEQVAARERDEKDAAFRRADGLRLAAHSQAVLDIDPELALALAVEAGGLHDGTQVLTALQEAIRRHQGHRRLEGRGSSLDFSPDSRLLAAHDGGEIQVVDVRTGEVEVRLLRQTFGGFSDDGSRMVTERGGGFTVWDTTTWEPILEVDPEKRVWGTQLTPDGESVVIRGFGDEHDVRVYHVDEAGPPRVLAGHTGSVESLTISPDGMRLLTTSREDRTARMWELATGRQLLVLKADDDDLEEVGPDGERETIAWFRGFFTSDGSRIVTNSANGTVRVWDSGSGERIEELTQFARQVSDLLPANDGDLVHLTVRRAGTPRVHVWEPATGRLTEMSTPPGGFGGIRHAAVSPDGSRVAHVMYRDPQVRVLDAATGEVVQTLSVSGERLTRAEFSPDGRWIATVSESGDLRLWEAESRERRSTLDPTASGSIKTACLNGDGSRLTTFGRNDGVAIVRDVETGRFLGREEIDPKEGNWGEISPDGSAAFKWMTAGGAEIAEVPGGRALADLENIYNVSPIGFSREGRYVAVLVNTHPAQDRQDLWLFDLREGRVTAKLGTDAAAVAFDRAGKRIVLAVSEWNEPARRVLHVRALHVCEVPSGETSWIHVLPDGEPLGEIDLDAAGDRILTWTNRELFVVDRGARDHRARLTVDRWIAEAGISADGARVFASAGKVRVWDAETGRPLFDLSGEPASVRWSPTGRRLLTAEWDGTARVRDGDTGEVLLTLEGHELPLHSAEFSGDGRRIATISYDLTARVWDAETGRELLKAADHRGRRLNAFCFLPVTGNILTVSRPGLAEIRDPSTWDLVARLEAPLSLSSNRIGARCDAGGTRVMGRHWRGVKLVFDTSSGELLESLPAEAGNGFPESRPPERSPDGTFRLDFTPGPDKRTHGNSVRVLDTATGEERVRLEGHTATVYTAAVGPAGKHVVTASADRTARVWDAGTGDELVTLPHPDEVRDAAISPDGTFLLTLCEGKLRRFPMDPLKFARSLGPRPLTAAERRRFEIGKPAVDAEKDDSAAVTEPDGRELYERLLEELGNERRVRERLAEDESLDPAARTAAAKIRLRAFDHGLTLNTRAYRIAVTPGKAEEEYLESLRMAEIAARLVPESGRVLATLGKAKVRTGAVSEALEILRMADLINTGKEGHGIPTDVAFLAMACLALDRRDEAEAEFARFKKLTELPEYADYPAIGTLKPLLKELNALFE